MAEARFLMLAANNLLKLSDGRPVAVPSQDMVLGSYYLTTIIDKNYATDEIRNPGVFTSIPEWEKAYAANPHPLKIYRSPDEALMAYQTGDLVLDHVARDLLLELLHVMGHLRPGAHQAHVPL